MELKNHIRQTNNGPLIPLWATIPLYIIVSLLFTGIIGGIVSFLLSFSPASDTVYYTMGEYFGRSLASLAAVWGSAVLFLIYIDRSSVKELGLSIKGRWKDCFLGFLFAAALYLIGFSASLGLGVVEIAGTSLNCGVLIGTFFVFLTAATMEEVMIRGYIQGRLMTKMNKFVATIIASLIFSAMHLLNPNIAFLPLLNLFLAGLLLGASYMYTRNLWFPICLHTGWNWIQGPILGYEVSGTSTFPSFIQQHLPEENILNGGNFGFEGSILCTVLMVIGTALIIGWYERKRSS